MSNRLKFQSKYNNVSNYVRRIVIFFTLITTLIVAVTFSINEVVIFYKIRSEQRENYLNEQKYFIRALIQNEVDYIADQKEQFDLRIKEQFKKEVLSVFNLADKLYNQYKGKMTNRQLKELIIHAISSQQSQEKYSKFFINTLDGYGVYYHGRESNKGVNLLNLKDINGNLVVKKEIESLQKKNEECISYEVDSPWIIDGTPNHKVTFVKKFGHFNWYFGYKGYLEDYYEDFKLEIAQKVSSVRFRHGGYIFLNETDGDPIVLDGKLYQGNFNFHDGTDSIKNSIFELQLEAANSLDGGGYFSYLWEKIEGGEAVPKISFVKKFESCNWLVGAGFYVDEIDVVLDAQLVRMKKSLLRNLLHIFLIFIAILALEYWLVYRFNSRYSDDFLHFTNFFRIGKGRYETIDVKKLHFEEFKQMGIIANEMIVEREKVYMQLVKEQKRATESDRLKTAFLANMSHEIRTPMNAILGFSSLMTDSELSQENKDEFSQIIIDNGEHLLELINDIIDVSKIESEQMSFKKKKFSLDKFVKGIEKHYKEVVSKRVENQIRFEVSIKLPVNYLCNTDEFRLKQVIDNLIGNAMKFTQRGSVTLAVSKYRNKIYFRVKDTGIGIPAEDLENIFYRFVQSNVDSKKNYGGTGLGLAISENIVKHLGGEIGVRSKQGKGSEFFFFIPA